MNYEKNKKLQKNEKSKPVEKKALIIQNQLKSNVTNNSKIVWKNSPKNKKIRSMSQLEIFKSVDHKEAEDIVLVRSESKNSEIVNFSQEKEREEDKFSATFKNMFENFSKLTEIMTSSSNIILNDVNKENTIKLSNSNFKYSSRKRIDTYAPLSQSDKLRYIDEINRNSEQRINSYHNIFSQIKSQIFKISDVAKNQSDEDEDEKDLISNLETKPDNMSYGEVLMKPCNDLSNNIIYPDNKNVNIINNNIIVNIISNSRETNKADIINNDVGKNYNKHLNQNVINEPKIINNSHIKGNLNNVSITYNDDTEEESKINEMISLPSNSFKNKTGLENHDSFVKHIIDKKDIFEVKVRTRGSTKLVKYDSNFMGDISNRNSDLRSSFLIAKSELNLMNQQKSNFGDSSNFGKLYKKSVKTRNSAINLNQEFSEPKKNCIII